MFFFRNLWKGRSFVKFISERNKVLKIYKKIRFWDDDKLKKTFVLLKEKAKKTKKEQQIGLLNNHLPLVYAIVREIIKRKIGLLLFPTQILGGIVLHYGNIAQMNTGEGKTLAAFLPACLNSLANRSVFVITVNEYLSKRDWNLAKPVLDFFDITSGFNSTTLSLEEKKELYEQKIIYTTSDELGFDYLRNNLILTKNEEINTDYYYAIIDEIDSVLLDEAQNPLNISHPRDRKRINHRIECLLATKLAEQLEEKKDYRISQKEKVLFLTIQGVKKSKHFYFQLDSFFSFNNQYRNFLLHNALKAKHFFLRNVDYIVARGRIININQLTGRLVFNQKYPYGIQHAIESKEGVDLSRDNIIVATITLQSFFRFFNKLSGMTGTAETEEEEFEKVYDLGVIAIPPYKKLIRKDYSDLFFFKKKDKYKAIIKKIEYINNTTKQPILIGTSNVEVSEHLSTLLQKEGIIHQKLNAINHEKEAEIIAGGGQIGSIIISTNMAGRGTDIILSPESKDSGGLFVIGVEDSSTKRLRMQLIGRAGRQGDPGKSQFFVSLEDDIIKRFGADNFFSTFSLNDPFGGGLQNFAKSAIISDIQETLRNIEAYNRQSSLINDLLINKQRSFLYEYRKRILNTDSFSELYKACLQKKKIRQK